MTIQQILGINKPLQKIADLKLPVQKAYKIYNLIKQLQKEQEFAQQEVQKIIQLHEAKIEDSGKVILTNGGDYAQFMKDYSALMYYQIDNIETIKLSFSELQDLQLSSSEIAALEGIIEFIEE